MSVAPERINIKRRRVDEPVDHLLYQSKKQRTSDHVFVRISLAEDKNTPPARLDVPPQTQTFANSTTKGIPMVKETKPGEEITDFQRYRAAQQPGLGRDSAGQKASTAAASQSLPSFSESSRNGRRFHLTRDLSTVLWPQSSGSIRKPKSTLRPHIPTFIERFQSSPNEYGETYAKEPIDRFVTSINGAEHEVDVKQVLSNPAGFQKQNVTAFKQPNKKVPKTGNSIHDDMDAWDLDSDQLAEELAAFALELDPEAKAAYANDLQAESMQLDTHRISTVPDDEPGEFVYETYIRVKKVALADLDLDTSSRSFGYLVVDDDEEDLWEQYLKDEEDEDDEWDEEDEDSNAEDNPRNDYPEEEVSSDDEYGMSAYKYRRHCSDDEHYSEQDG